MLTLEELEAVESLALFTFSVAMSHKLAEEGVRPQALTGHSFGEFAGLVVSGILDFETGLSCVLSREKCLGERNKAGFMVAVNTSELKIRELLPQTKIHISNVNSLTQTVISTTWEHLQEIESTLKESEIKYKRLASPQPFHSPLLEDFASELLLPSLDTHLVTAPRTPFFSGVETSDTEKLKFHNASTKLVEFSSNLCIAAFPSVLIKSSGSLPLGINANLML
jgi:acyl transferase domain-containing protein